jgi:hypothetical protein
MTKLLVATGQISGTFLASVEIINLDDPNLICDNLPDLAVSIIAPTGQLFAKQQPIICGGVGSISYCNCHSYGNNKWQSIQSLRECKFGSASAVFSNPNGNATDIILVTGGHNGSLVSTVESFDGGILWNQTMFAQLPAAVFYHCLVKINNTILLQMGGSIGGGAASSTTKTYFFEMVQNMWISGELCFLKSMNAKIVSSDALFITCYIIKY